ncbi:hypothetical protein KAR91_77910 [Candidatus Pacearchaeota archaeon]|nr:hypothetical protein [Candidatus Pacearchaeota archaeon]
MKKDYGWVWINNVQRIICAVKDITRGPNKGKVEVTFCRGRNSDGSIRPGAKKIIPYQDLIEFPAKVI